VADHGLYSAKEGGRNTVVVRGALKSSGVKPVKYTTDLLEILHNYAVKKGSANWWKYLETTNEKARSEALEFARNTLADKEVLKK
jgi:hypothetical protein